MYHVDNYFTPKNISKNRCYSLPFTGGKIRPKNVKQFAQDHTGRKEERQKFLPKSSSP